MEKFEDKRNRFLKMRGGKLISIEAYVLAFIVFVALVLNNYSPVVALGVAFVVGFIFPILVGTFKSIAWLAAILFSFLWGVFGGLLVGEFAGAFIGFILGIVFAVGSFIIHKHYAGLTLNGITLKKKEKFTISDDMYFAKEDVQFCPECGRRINSSTGLCDMCNK